MNVKKLKITSIILTLILFISPVAATLFTPNSTQDEKLSEVISILMLGMYNIAFISVSIIAIIAGLIFQKKHYNKYALFAFSISIACCLIGIGWVLLWTLSTK